MHVGRFRFLGLGLIVCLTVATGAYFLLRPNEPDRAVATDKPSFDHTTAKPLLAPFPFLPDTNWQLPLSPVPTLSSTLSYSYNARGQLQSITYPDNTVYSYEYNDHGDKIRETTRTGRVWSYVYDQNHHPLRIIDPEGRVTPPDLISDPSGTK